MVDSRHLIFDRALIRARRERMAASQDDRVAFLARWVADDIAERLAFIRRRFPIALDLCAAEGHLGRRLLEGNFGIDLLISADPAPRLLDRAAGLKLVADEELLPLRQGTLDLVVSGLALQHANDLPGALIQIRRSLKPDGLMIAALLGGRTLEELREAFVVAETETTGGASPRVAPFADVRDLGGLLQRAGFSLPVADSETLEVGYASPLHLMRDLRDMGWANALTDRSRALLRRATLARAIAVYQDRHGRADGRVNATFEIVTLTGWAPHESQQKPLRPGSAAHRLADALHTTERPAGDEP